MKHICLLIVAVFGLLSCTDEKLVPTDVAALTDESDVEALPTKEEEEALKQLAKPAPGPIPKPGSLERFFVDLVKDLMVNGEAKFDKTAAILRILNDLDAMGLTPQGRPEGLVHDVVTRMVEDMKSFRPDDFTAEKLSLMDKTMLTRLGKSYLVDLKNVLNPDGKEHGGKLRQVTMADPEKVRDGYKAITWKTISGFRFDEKVPFPKAVQDLDGKKVALVGFMYPSKEYEDIHEFLVVESMWTCCFGKSPQVTQVVKTVLDPKAPGLWVMTAPIIVHGTFHVKIEKEDGWIIGAYRISADFVEEYK